MSLVSVFTVIALFGLSHGAEVGVLGVGLVPPRGGAGGVGQGVQLLRAIPMNTMDRFPYYYSNRPRTVGLVQRPILEDGLLVTPPLAGRAEELLPPRDSNLSSRQLSNTGYPESVYGYGSYNNLPLTYGFPYYYGTTIGYGYGMPQGAYGSQGVYGSPGVYGSQGAYGPASGQLVI